MTFNYSHMASNNLPSHLPNNGEHNEGNNYEHPHKKELSAHCQNTKKSIQKILDGKGQGLQGSMAEFNVDESDRNEKALTLINSNRSCSIDHLDTFEGLDSKEVALKLIDASKKEEQ